MGKVKKILNDDKKLSKRNSILRKTEQSKTPKNRRKNLSAILTTPQKTFQQVTPTDSNSVKSGKKENIKALTQKKSGSVKAKNKNLKRSPKSTEKESSLKSNKSPTMKRKKVSSDDTVNIKEVSKEGKKKKSTQSHSSNGKLLQTENSNKNKFIPKTKKTTAFKHKSQKFKVKTALIFNQKPKDKISDVVNIKEDTVRSGIKALFNIIEEKKDDKSLFEDEVPIFLHFSSVKIGRTPSRTLRIPLKHSLLTDSGEVCLITDDRKGHIRKEYEKTVEHYENLLKEKDVTNIKTIMPFYQLKTEYSEFELKRKLVELYDVFLVDAKISGYVVKKLGKIFRDKRKLPIPVRLDANNLKEHINFALSKTSTNLHPNGDNFTIQIAHSEMSEDQIYENFVEACMNLAKNFPGGWDNIRGLNLKTPKSLSIPVYYTLKNSSKMSVPVVKAKRPKAFKEVSGELSTTYDREVRVLPSGEVFLKKIEDVQQKQSKKKKVNKERSNMSKENVNKTLNGFSKQDNLNDSDGEVEKSDTQVEANKQKKVKKVKSPKAQIKATILKKQNAKMKSKREVNANNSVGGKVQKTGKNKANKGKKKISINSKNADAKKTKKLKKIIQD